MSIPALATVRGAALRCSARLTHGEARAVRCLSSLGARGWLRIFFVAASRLGDGPLWVAVAASLLGFGGTRGASAAFWAALAVGISTLVFVCVKRAAGRPRPFETCTEVRCLLAPPDRFSFPSGHTMTAFAAWSVLSQTVPGSGRLFLPTAMVIGLSRVCLGVHYPTDVLAGALLGSGIGFGVLHLAAGRF